MDRNFLFDKNSSKKNNHRKKTILTQHIKLSLLSLNNHLQVLKESFIKNENRDGQKEIHKMRTD